jgi:hypothetical protein
VAVFDAYTELCHLCQLESQQLMDCHLGVAPGLIEAVFLLLITSDQQMSSLYIGANDTAQNNLRGT